MQAIHKKISTKAKNIKKNFNAISTVLEHIIL